MSSSSIDFRQVRNEERDLTALAPNDLRGPSFELCQVDSLEALKVIDQGSQLAQGQGEFGIVLERRRGIVDI